MGMIASQITSLTIVYLTFYLDADQSKHQSSVSLAFVWGIHRGPVNSSHKWPVTRQMFPSDDLIMIWNVLGSVTFLLMSMLHKNLIYYNLDITIKFAHALKFVVMVWFLCLKLQKKKLTKFVNNFELFHDTVPCPLHARSQLHGNPLHTHSTTRQCPLK